MARRAWIAAGLLALPAAAAEPPPPSPDPEFLEFLAESAGEDEEFAKYVESKDFERELQKVETQRAPAEDEDHEP
jgi:hypothetical protein